MQLSPNEQNNFSLSKFESMLKTNSVLFFDSEEFEQIIHYYLENGKISLAKKATKLGLEQHPTATNLKLFQIEMFIFENKLDKVLGDLFNNSAYSLTVCLVLKCCSTKKLNSLIISESIFLFGCSVWDLNNLVHKIR